MSLLSYKEGEALVESLTGKLCVIFDYYQKEGSYRGVYGSPLVWQDGPLHIGSSLALEDGTQFCVGFSLDHLVSERILRDFCRRYTSGRALYD